MEGWLKKKSPSAFAGLQERWFSLREANIYYYKDKTDSEAKGVIPLSALKGVSVKGSKFEIDVGYRVFELTAKTENEAKKWAAAIEGSGSNKTKPKAAARAALAPPGNCGAGPPMPPPPGGPSAGNPFGASSPPSSIPAPAGGAGGGGTNPFDAASSEASSGSPGLFTRMGSGLTGKSGGQSMPKLNLGGGGGGGSGGPAAGGFGLSAPQKAMRPGVILEGYLSK